GGAVVVAGEGGERQGGDPDQAGAARHRRSLPSDETPSDAGGRAHAARTTSRASNRARPRGPVTAASSPARPAPRLTGPLSLGRARAGRAVRATARRPAVPPWSSSRGLVPARRLVAGRRRHARLSTVPRRRLHRVRARVPG